MKHSACSKSRGWGVTPTSNRKQAQDISAKFRCEVARNGRVKKSKFYTPSPNFFGRGGVGVGCYPNCRVCVNQQQNIM